jgi:hypothetical protein
MYNKIIMKPWRRGLVVSSPAVEISVVRSNPPAPRNRVVDFNLKKLNKGNRVVDFNF